MDAPATPFVAPSTPFVAPAPRAPTLAAAPRSTLSGPSPFMAALAAVAPHVAAPPPAASMTALLNQPVPAGVSALAAASATAFSLSGFFDTQLGDTNQAWFKITSDDMAALQQEEAATAEAAEAAETMVELTQMPAEPAPAAEPTPVAEPSPAEPTPMEPAPAAAEPTPMEPAAAAPGTAPAAPTLADLRALLPYPSTVEGARVTRLRDEFVLRGHGYTPLIATPGEQFRVVDDAMRAGALAGIGKPVNLGLSETARPQRPVKVHAEPRPMVLTYDGGGVHHFEPPLVFLLRMCTLLVQNPALFVNFLFHTTALDSDKFARSLTQMSTFLGVQSSVSDTVPFYGHHGFYYMLARMAPAADVPYYFAHEQALREADGGGGEIRLANRVYYFEQTPDGGVVRREHPIMRDDGAFREFEHYLRFLARNAYDALTNSLVFTVGNLAARQLVHARELRAPGNETAVMLMYAACYVPESLMEYVSTENNVHMLTRPHAAYTEVRPATPPATLGAWMDFISARWSVWHGSDKGPIVLEAASADDWARMMQLPAEEAMAAAAPEARRVVEEAGVEAFLGASAEIVVRRLATAPAREVRVTPAFARLVYALRSLRSIPCDAEVLEPPGVRARIALDERALRAAGHVLKPAGAGTRATVVDPEGIQMLTAVLRRVLPDEPALPELLAAVRASRVDSPLRRPIKSAAEEAPARPPAPAEAPADPGAPARPPAPADAPARARPHTLDDEPEPQLSVAAPRGKRKKPVTRHIGASINAAVHNVHTLWLDERRSPPWIAQQFITHGVMDNAYLCVLLLAIGAAGAAEFPPWLAVVGPLAPRITTTTGGVYKRTANALYTLQASSDQPADANPYAVELAPVGGSAWFVPASRGAPINVGVLHTLAASQYALFRVFQHVPRLGALARVVPKTAVRVASARVSWTDQRVRAHGREVDVVWRDAGSALVRGPRRVTPGRPLLLVLDRERAATPRFYSLGFEPHTMMTLVLVDGPAGRRGLRHYLLHVVDALHVYTIDDSVIRIGVQ